jgi:hypothetical protein
MFVALVLGLVMVAGAEMVRLSCRRLLATPAPVQAIAHAEVE